MKIKMLDTVEKSIPLTKAERIETGRRSVLLRLPKDSEHDFPAPLANELIEFGFAKKA